MNGDGSEKIDDGTVDGAPPRAGICRCFALTHCRSTGIKPILKCLLFCPYRNTVREHDPGGRRKWPFAIHRTSFFREMTSNPNALRSLPKSNAFHDIGHLLCP